MKKQRSNKLRPELSIIFVNYNGKAWLEKCLTSLQHLSSDQRAVIEMIVVDNGSNDGSVSWLKKQKGIRLIELSENRGFSGGNNVGIQHAEAPFILLLNTDTELPADTDLLALLKNFENPQVGIVTPKILLASGKLDHACHRGFPTPWNAAMYYSGIAKLFPRWKAVAGYRQSWKDLAQKHEVEACSGAAMIVRAEALEKVGLLDESFFMYAEDIDWCYRFAQNGYTTIYDPAVTILHHKYKSGQQTAKWETKKKTTSAFFDTMKQFMDKHYQEKYPKFVLRLSSVMIDLLKYWKLTNERMKYERTVSSK